MKTFRLLFIVMLALLLPVRGALAAGVFCHSAMPSHASAAMQEPTHPHSHASHESADAHGMEVKLALSDELTALAHMDFTDTGNNTTTASSLMAGADACSVCASCCSAAAVISTPPPLAMPPATGSAPLPFAVSAAPGFIPDGLERPPRSI